QDELELSGIGHDVADGEDAGDVRGASRRVDLDVMPAVVEREAPVRDRPEIDGEPEEGEEGVRRHRLRSALEVGEGHRGEYAVGAFEREEQVGDDKLEPPLFVAII